MCRRLTVLTVMLTAVFCVGAEPAAALPVTKSRPYEAVCEAQGGTFSVSINSKDLYCDKAGALFTAFTPAQLAVQRTLCEHVYGAFFGLNGSIQNGVTFTHTFCATSA